MSSTIGLFQDIFVNKQPQEHGFHGFDQCRGSVSSMQNKVVNNTDFTNSYRLDIQQDVKQNTAASNSDSSIKLDFHQLDSHQDFDYGLLIGANDTEQCEQDAMPDVLPNICPPPSAFLGPKCALWDCFRPAQGSKWCEDYCSTVHSVLALNEGLPDMTPILRPGGISLKDGPLFAALNAKAQGKKVGIPQCEGAASRKSPWTNPGRPTWCLLLLLLLLHSFFVFRFIYLICMSVARQLPIILHIHFALCLL